MFFVKRFSFSVQQQQTSLLSSPVVQKNFKSPTKIKQSLKNFTQATKAKPSSFEKTCQICGEIINSGINEFHCHMQKHSSLADATALPSTSAVQLAKYVCQQCNLTFENELDFANHFLSCGKYPIVQSQPDCSRFSSIEQNKSLSQTFSCSCCGFKTIDESKFDEHFKHCRTTSFVCHVCKQPFVDRGQMYDHYASEHKMTTYSCDLCSKSFKTDLGYKNHCEMHKSVVYKCELCDFKTKTKTYLNLHMIKYHETTLSGRSKAKKFACSQCGLTFIFDSLLKRHYQSKHLKLKPYQCPYCEYSATENNAVKLHVRSAHTFVK